MFFFCIFVIYSYPSFFNTLNTAYVLIINTL
nr:MAG TPA: hypothetical protein [Caudoviricetes sp.]DAX25029.1 MAG TPA: hypothetical protein [Caudoviricetes sp.]